MGQHASPLGTHLIEFVWRRRFDERPFENLVRCIQDKHPVYRGVAKGGANGQLPIQNF